MKGTKRSNRVRRSRMSVSTEEHIDERKNGLRVLAFICTSHRIRTKLHLNRTHLGHQKHPEISTLVPTVSFKSKSLVWLAIPLTSSSVNQDAFWLTLVATEPSIPFINTSVIPPVPYHGRHVHYLRRDVGGHEGSSFGKIRDGSAWPGW